MQGHAAAPIATWFATHPEALVAKDGSCGKGQGAPRSVPRDPESHRCGCPTVHEGVPPGSSSLVCPVPNDVEGSYVVSLTTLDEFGMERIFSMGCRKEGVDDHHEDPSSKGGHAGR